MTQPLSLRDQLKALEHLQELDLNIDGLKGKKAALPGARKAAEDVLGKARNAVDAKKNAIAEVEKLKRQTQAAVEINNDRLTRANGKLESVQNGQEYQAANKELDQLRKQSLSLQEQLKKADADLGTLANELNQATEQYSKMESEHSTQASALSGQAEQLDREIEKLVSQRQQYTVQVDKRVLMQYDRVRGARGGLGIVPAVAGRCKGCNMVVPPQLYNEVQRGQNIQACPSCHRILFVPGEARPNDASAHQS